jgi:hypothetical protein
VIKRVRYQQISSDFTCGWHERATAELSVMGRVAAILPNASAQRIAEVLEKQREWRMEPQHKLSRRRCLNCRYNLREQELAGSLPLLEVNPHRIGGQRGGETVPVWMETQCRSKPEPKHQRLGVHLHLVCEIPIDSAITWVDGDETGIDEGQCLVRKRIVGLVASPKDS